MKKMKRVGALMISALMLLGSVQAFADEAVTSPETETLQASESEADNAEMIVETETQVKIDAETEADTDSLMPETVMETEETSETEAETEETEAEEIGLEYYDGIFRAQTWGDNGTQWDTLWFGSYPQVEIVKDTDSINFAVNHSGKPLENILSEEDYIVDPDLYEALSAGGSHWNADNTTTIAYHGNIERVYRVNRDSAFSYNEDVDAYAWIDSKTYHYFLFQPIKWRVLYINYPQTALLLSDKVLTCASHGITSAAYSWETSRISTMLNNDFMNRAFTPAEQAAMIPKQVTTDGVKTENYVWIPSAQEIQNTSYGFEAGNTDMAKLKRSARSTTFAKAMGAAYNGWTDINLGYSYYTLRDRSINNNDKVCRVISTGILDSNGVISLATDSGIRPMIQVNLLSSDYLVAGEVYSDGSVNEVPFNKKQLTLEPVKTTRYWSDLESMHDYEPSKTQTWIYRYENDDLDVSTIEYIFDEQSYTEDGFDYLDVYSLVDGKETLVESFTGDFGGKSVTVPGKEVKFVLRADKATQYYGFKVTDLNVNIGNVKNVKAVAAGKNKVNLTWDPVKGAAGYLIYAKKDGVYKYLSMTTTGTSYTDTKALDTDYNFYWVYAYKMNGDKKMPGGCEKYAFAKGTLTAVSNIKGASQVGGVKISWEKHPEADGYIVTGIRGTEPYGPVGNTVGTSYVDKSASKTDWNYYWVTPFHYSADRKVIAGQVKGYVYGKAR